MTPGPDPVATAASQYRRTVGMAWIVFFLIAAAPERRRVVMFFVVFAFSVAVTGLGLFWPLAYPGKRPPGMWPWVVISGLMTGLMVALLISEL